MLAMLCNRMWSDIFSSFGIFIVIFVYQACTKLELKKCEFFTVSINGIFYSQLKHQKTFIKFKKISLK